MSLKETCFYSRLYGMLLFHCYALYVYNSITFLLGHSHANHAAELEKLRELLNSGLSLGELFSTGLGHSLTISNPKKVTV